MDLENESAFEKSGNSRFFTYKQDSHFMFHLFASFCAPEVEKK